MGWVMVFRALTESTPLSCLYNHGSFGKGNLSGIIDERGAHIVKTDFDAIAGLEVWPIWEGKFHRPEKVDMDIAGSAKVRILEMVVLKVGKAMAHVTLARQQFA